MAITDINISEQLETSAPSIKYEGNEGPQSPQQEQRMAELKREYMQYVFEQKDLDEPIMSFEEWYQAVYQASKMSVQAPQEQITAEEVMTRAPAAFGGIMDRYNRRRYAFGGIKKRLRKLIPNEVAKVAEVAAPFVAPFNPLIGGAMAGLGGFDRHGSLGRGLKSGLMTYGGGQAARYLGGAELQGNPFTQGGIKGAFQMPGGGYFSKPMGTQDTGFNKWFGGDKTSTGLDEVRLDKKFDIPKDQIGTLGDPREKLDFIDKTKGNNLNLLDRFLEKAGMNTAAMAGILGASTLAGLYTKKNPGDDSLDKIKRGEGMDIESIRTEVVEAFKDPTGKALEEIRIKYPFLGAKETKNLDLMAQGGRAGFYAGGQSIPSDYTMEDARKTSMQDKMGGITEAMKIADLYRKGDVGQFYAAQGGRIGYAGGGILNMLRRLMTPEAKRFKKFNYSQGITDDYKMDITEIMEEMSEKIYGKPYGNLNKKQQMKIFDAANEERANIESLRPAPDDFAQGGRIGYDAGGLTGHPPITTGQIQVLPQMPGPQAQRPNPMPAPQPNRMAAMNPMMGGMHPMMGGRGMNPMMGGRGMNPMMGGRRMAQEGGLMDLGGMEKDYRNDGGFVPIGGEEKADDVPARLSKNEFVFTADAVRGAGGGDIDKGAEIMENVMENLEQGGQISEESQGLAGAREMFDVSERLSEVV